MPILLNVGVDVGKETLVVACAEDHFPVPSVPNQGGPLLAWLKALPGGTTA